MSEQQYRVVADRDNGDDIRKRFVRGDRVTFGSDADGGTVPVRIERLMPTADEPKYPAGFWATHVEDPVTGAITNEDGSPYVTPSPHLPTREQIRDAARRAFAEWYETDETGDGFFRRFDDALGSLSPLPPREQIAGAVLSAMAPAIPDRGARNRASYRVADAVLALFGRNADAKA